MRRPAIVALALGLVLALAPAAQASARSNVQIGLCHRTGAAGSALAFITVDSKAVAAHLAQGDSFARGPADCEGPYYHYVTDTMKFGQSVAEADTYAFNLDNDGRGIPDNALGHVFAGLTSIFGVDGNLAASLQAGEVVVLHSIRADSLRRDRSAAWRVSLGTPQPDPVLKGGGSFAVDPAAPTSTELDGAITRGQFAGGVGSVPVRLGLVPGQPPIELHLVAAQIQADCDGNGFGCTGKLGGGVSASELDTVIIPALAALIQVQIDASCTISNPESCSAVARQLLDLFDVNHDLMVTADELRQNSLIRAILQPDVDLLNADGSLGRDGVKESVSLGLGFTARYAIFTAPGES